MTEKVTIYNSFTQQSKLQIVLHRKSVETSIVRPFNTYIKHLCQQPSHFRCRRIHSQLVIRYTYRQLQYLQHHAWISSSNRGLQGRTKIYTHSTVAEYVPLIVQQQHITSSHCIAVTQLILFQSISYTRNTQYKNVNTTRPENAK
jgi:hypothetical protein